MRHRLALWLAVALLAPLGARPASAASFQEARLTVTQITRITAVGAAAATPFEFNAVERTDDSGGLAGEEGKNDGFPDPGEVVLERLGDDYARLTIENKPAPGVSPGIPVVVTRVDVTYLDARGQSRAFAPRITTYRSALVPTGGTATVDFLLVPYEMKVPKSASVRGLRDMVLFPASVGEAQDVSTWTAVIDVYGEAVKPATGSLQAPAVRQALRFKNPMVQ